VKQLEVGMMAPDVSTAGVHIHLPQCCLGAATRIFPNWQHSFFPSVLLPSPPIRSPNCSCEQSLIGFC